MCFGGKPPRSGTHSLSLGLAFPEGILQLLGVWQCMGHQAENQGWHQCPALQKVTNDLVLLPAHLDWAPLSEGTVATSSAAAGGRPLEAYTPPGQN